MGFTVIEFSDKPKWWTLMKNGYINDIKQQHMSFVSLHGDILGFIPWDISTLFFFEIFRSIYNKQEKK